MGLRILNTLYLIIGLLIIFIGIVAIFDGQYLAFINFIIGGSFTVDAINNYLELKK